MPSLRLYYVALLFLIMTLPSIILQFCIIKRMSHLSHHIPQKYLQWMCKLLRIHIHIIGTPLTNVPVLYTANHWSWMDIPVLGSVLKCSFVAKSDIAGWPIFGLLAKLNNTIFVNRSARQDALNQANMITEHFKQNKAVILFAEGTSNDGNRVLNFKSSLFSVAKPMDNIKPFVQPVTLYYNRLYNMPLGRSNRPYVAWYGDMDVIPHLIKMIGLGPIEVVISFGDAVSYDDFGCRKALTEYVEKSVRSEYTRLASGQKT